jgi:hypothetical protein
MRLQRIKMGVDDTISAKFERVVCEAWNESHPAEDRLYCKALVKVTTSFM